MIHDSTADAVWDKWNSDVRTICGSFRTDIGVSGRPFRGKIDFHSALGVSYASIETNARKVYRCREDVASDGLYYFLIYQARGRSLITQSGRSALLNPTDMVLVDSGEPCEFLHSGTIRHLSFHLSRSLLQHMMRTADVPTAHRLPSETAIGSLLSVLVQQIHSRSVELAAFDTPALEEALAAILVPLLQQCRSEVARVDHGLEPVTMVAVCRYVDANLRNATLCPRSIARALGCSVRHVHRAFESTGTTVSRYVKAKRLDACARELRDAVRAQDSVTDIALRWGFSEVSHFSRSFKERFGCGPLEFRRIAALGRDAG